MRSGSDTAGSWVWVGVPADQVERTVGGGQGPMVPLWLLVVLGPVGFAVGMLIAEPVAGWARYLLWLLFHPPLHFG